MHFYKLFVYFYIYVVALQVTSGILLMLTLWLLWAHQVEVVTL